MKSTIRNLVKNLIEKYNTNNPFELSKILNIIVVKESLDPNVKGFYQYFQRNKIIYLNNKLSEEELIIVCAHELGHAVLHSKLNVMFLEKSTFYVKNKFEIEANKFAAELLIPYNIATHYPEYYSLEQIALSEHMPIELLKLKLNI